MSFASAHSLVSSTFGEKMNWLTNIFKRKKRSCDNLTPRSQKLLALARKVADQHHHRYVGTEHLLGGLLILNEGVAISVLKSLGVDLEKLERDSSKEIKDGNLMSPPAMLPYTPLFKKVIDYGEIEAQQLGHDYIGTEHLLLGMLRLKKGPAFKALTASNIDIKAARLTLIQSKETINPNQSQ